MSGSAARSGPRLVSPEEVTLEKPLPHNLDAERAILGAVMLENSSLRAAQNLVQAVDFFLPQHRHIFEEMLELADNGQLIDTITLMEQLKRSGNLEAAGGVAYLSQLADGLQRAVNVPHHARIVREKSILRNICHSAYRLYHRTLEMGVTPDDLAADLAAVAETVTSQVGSQSTLETLSIPDMPENVLDGRLGEICSRRLATYPRSYGWLAILAAGSVLVPTNPERTIRTNVYAAQVGGKGTGKSRSNDDAAHIMGVGEPFLTKTLAGSAEGLIDRLSESNGAARLLSPDELAHLLSKAKIDFASFPHVLNTAYYQQKFEVRAAKRTRFEFNCSLSIVGGIVQENFEDCFGRATVGGLYDRFLFGLCPQPYQHMARPVYGAPEDAEPCDVIIHADVWEARDEWLRTVPGMSGRIAEHALRCAVIAASFSGRSILYAKDLGPAKVLAEYQTRVRRLLQPNPGENTDARCAFAILAALSSEWTEKRQLMRKIHYERFGPSVFERALGSLAMAEEIKIDKNKPVKIRKARP